MAGKELRYSLDNSWCVDAEAISAYPPARLFKKKKKKKASVSQRNSRLTLEIFHDIKKPIVYIWLLGKLHLDLVQVAEGIL
jgi:hypothetical protein